MANKVYKVDETAKVFTSSGGDAAWTTENIGNAAGRQSVAIDLGALGTSKSRLYKWQFETQLQATPTVGNVLQIYLKQSDDNSVWDNDDGTGDIAVSASDKLRNLTLIGLCVVDEAAANIPTVARGTVEINTRYIAAVFWNASGASTKNTANVTKLTLTPVPDEIQ